MTFHPRHLVNQRSQGICEICANPHPVTHHHHRQPTDIHPTPAGMLLLCAPCHTATHTNPTKSHTNGWLINDHTNPASVPVLRHNRTVLLTDDGTITDLPGPLNQTPDEDDYPIRQVTI